MEYDTIENYDEFITQSISLAPQVTQPPIQEDTASIVLGAFPDPMVFLYTQEMSRGTHIFMIANGYITLQYSR